MSQQQTRCAKGSEISHPGAYARHADACDTCTRGAGDAETAENGGIRASDLQMDEIRAAIEGADADTLDATLALHEHTPADGDTREDAAAKALISAKSGGREAYDTVFGPCPVDGCTYGRNGLRAQACKTHEGEAETGGSEPETPESEGSRESEPADTDALPSEGQIAGRLISEGMSPEKAANASEFVRDAIREGASASEAVEAYQALKA